MKDDIKQIVSKVLYDGTIIETIYNPEIEKTAFAICKGEKIIHDYQYQHEEITFVPIKGSSAVIQAKVVLFPTVEEEYDNMVSLIQEIQTFIHKYVEISEFFELVSTYYVLLSWLYDKFNELPYLRVIADYGSGKTRFLQTIGSICYKPIFASGATTTSPIFRMIDLIQGTMVLDEADFKSSDTTQEIVKILNNGYSKGFPVLRSEVQGKNFEVKAYDVFSPKVIASRDYFQDIALESRCMVEVMERRKRNNIPLSIGKEFWEEAEKLRNKLLMFRFRTFHKEIKVENIVDHRLEPRLNQVMLPILSIIEEESLRNQIVQFFVSYNEEIIKDRAFSFDGDIFMSLLEAIEDSTEPTIKEVTEKYNNKVSQRDAIRERKMGHFIRKTFNLDTRRSNSGIKVCSHPENTRQIEKLFEKYGLKEKVPISCDELVKTTHLVFGES